MKYTSTFLFLIIVQSVDAAFNELKFKEVVAKMEQDALDLATEVERLYSTKRCLASTYHDCEKANYDQCLSLYPNQACLGGSNFLIPACNGEVDDPEEATCSGLYDMSIS